MVDMLCTTVVLLQDKHKDGLQSVLLSLTKYVDLSGLCRTSAALELAFIVSGSGQIRQASVKLSVNHIIPAIFVMKHLPQFLFIFKRCNRGRIALYM